MTNRKQRIVHCMFKEPCDLKCHSSRRGTYCEKPEEYRCNQNEDNYERIQRILKFLNDQY